MPIFRVTRDGEIVLDKEVIKLCPKLSLLNENEVKYMICAYDYIDSPWHRKPEEERKIIARRTYYKDKETPEKNDYFKEALEEYESCIFEIRKYTAETYKNRIYKFDRLIMSTDDPSELKKFDNAISVLQKRLDQVNDELKSEEELLEIKGGKKLSLIERLRKNRKLWTEYKKEIETDKA